VWASFGSLGLWVADGEIVVSLARNLEPETLYLAHHVAAGPHALWMIVGEFFELGQILV
jgi:hypothetical protein